MIIFATGFDAMTGPLLRMNITGRDGRQLKEAWSTGPRSYLGLQVPGFPNLFTITGPGSPSVLCNMPVAIEQHVDFITDCIAHMHAHRLFCVEATPDATEKWVSQVNEAASVTLLPQAKHSWYLGANSLSASCSSARVSLRSRRRVPSLAIYQTVADLMVSR